MAIKSLTPAIEALGYSHRALKDTDAKLLQAPRELINWLARLRLLEGVPFSYLIPHDELLPPESIRFFYMNRNWTDIAVDGALSVGAITTRDYSHLHKVHAAIREKVDIRERQVLAQNVNPKTILKGKADVITGFLLRSRVVSGWPGLHITAKRADSEQEETKEWPQLRLLRIERLSPAVLLVLVDGIPDRVEIEEPRQGVQFGVDGKHNGFSYSLKLKSKNGGKIIDNRRVGIRFRPNSPGVIDVTTLRAKLIEEANDIVGDSVSSAEFAQQMMQYPFMQPFDQQDLPERKVFKANIDFSVVEQSHTVEVGDDI